MTLFAWLGVCTAIILALAILSFSAGYLCEAIERLWKRHDDRIAIEARRELGRMIANDSCWLGENEAAMLAIKVLGRRIGEHGSYNMDNVREEWRKRYATAAN